MTTLLDQTVSPLVAKAVVVVAPGALLVLPALAHRGDAAGRVVERRKGVRERLRLAVTFVGFALPLLWVASPVPEFAERRSTLLPFASGLVLLAVIRLSLVSLAHLLRVVFGVELVAGDVAIPRWASVVGFLVPGAIAVLLWREGRRPPDGR